MAGSSAETEFKIDVRRTFRTTAQRLFAAWTQPDEVAEWMCHDGEVSDVKVVKHDIRPGGSLRLESIRRKAPVEQILYFVTFEDVRPPDALSFTWAWERTLPADPWLTSDGETRVAVTLTARGDGAELRLVQGPFPTAARRDREDKLWRGSFDALERWLARS